MTNLPQLEEKIYSLVPELVHKTHNSTYHRYYYTYDEIQIKHWLPLLKGDCAIDGNGKIMEHGWSDAYPCSGFFEGCAQYDFQKSFKDQSPEFHEWLWEQLQS